MKRTWVLFLAIAAGGPQALAQCDHRAGCVERGGYDCNHVQKGKGCQQKGNGEPESAPEPENGAYVAPPRNGTEVGESSGVGVEGMSLTFPTLTLKLPSLQMPCINRFRKGPRMMVDSAEAAYVANVPRAEFSQEASKEERAPDNGEQENQPDDTPERGPTQKGKYSPQQNCPTQNWPTASGNANSPEFVRWQQAQAENAALMQRIQQLEAVCHQLESRLSVAPPPAPAANAQSNYRPVNPQEAQIAALQQQLAAMQQSIARLQPAPSPPGQSRSGEPIGVYEAGPPRHASVAAYSPVAPKSAASEFRRLPNHQPLGTPPRLIRFPAVDSRR